MDSFNRMGRRALAHIRSLGWRGAVSAGLIAAGCVLVLLYLALNGLWPFTPSPPETPPQPEEVSPAVSGPVVPEYNELMLGGYDYPTDVLFISEERTRYADEDMTLKIPSLGLSHPVYNGVDGAALKKGPGLYDYSPLPGPGNPNVSIAGHRDIHGSVFYFIDRLGPGDLIYLIYEDKVYTYEYVETTVVEPDDWTPIYCVDYSAVTLTSCTPIGTNRQRIIVRGRLTDISSCTGDTQFPDRVDGNK